jgi:hypothetical protein
MNYQGQRVINPLTGKPIIVGGSTYNSLVAQGVNLSKAPKTTGVKRPIQRKKGGASNDIIDQVLAMGLYTPPPLEMQHHLAEAPWQEREYQKLMAHKGDSRGSPTRGWRLRAPQKGTERHNLLKKCGEKCFLGGDESFPICPGCDNYEGDCQCLIDCAGAEAAYIRARQWGHEDVAALSQRVLKEKCGRM